MARLS